MIQKIQINNFRNIENQLLTFNNGINYFIANNAQGKTNFIEALYYLGHNKSFKTKNIKNIIQFNKNSLTINALVKNIKIKINKQIDKTNISINNQKILNSSLLTKTIPMQLITPDRGFLVGGNNKNKRQCLDWGVFHVEQNFFSIHKKYKKIQKNINYLINKNQEQQLKPWFKEFAKVTTNINNIRINYLKQLKTINTNNLFNNFILNPHDFNYNFCSGLPIGLKNNEKDIYNFLNNNVKKIIKNKYLKYGPHLATINFSFKNIKEEQLSRGEQKTLSIIFLLTQVLHLIQKNIEIIILIDDLSSELDKNKIKIIINFLEKIKIQTFITSIHPTNNTNSFWNIKNGEIVYNG